MSNLSNISTLIGRCKKYERKAQKELYLHFADKLMNTAIRYAKDKSHAEDLVHDTFINVFNNIDKYKAMGFSFEGWIKRILINEALQGFRKSKRIGDVDEESLQMIPSEDLSAIDNLQANDVLDLLNKLPEGCKLIFNLYVIEGYKHKEISEMLKITAGASRAQLTRAKKMLRILLHNSNSCIAE